MSSRILHGEKNCYWSTETKDIAQIRVAQRGAVFMDQGVDDRMETWLLILCRPIYNKLN